MGIAVRTSVGYPKFWRGPPLEYARLCAPTGVWGQVEPGSMAYTEGYLKLLEGQAGDLAAELKGISRRHPGRPLVLLCFCNIHATRYCHRLDLAAWLEDRTGLEIPELSPRPNQASLFA